MSDPIKTAEHCGNFPTQQREEIATPRTDYEESRLDQWFNGRRMVYGDTARALERELTAHSATCEELRKENERLRQITGLRWEDADEWSMSDGATDAHYTIPAEARITALEAECKELRRDKERLDWLIAEAYIGAHGPGANEVALSIGSSVRDCRAAIDATLKPGGQAPS